MTPFDAIVIGLGGMGSATAADLARRGHRVLGLEQFAFDHTLGSSHGQTRIIRQAYFEHPNYVPLLQAAYTGWEALAATTENELINLSGLVLSGPATGEIVAGTRAAAEIHRLPLESVAIDAAHARFPGLHFHDEDAIIHESLGGYLRVEACVAAHLDEARRHGADLHENEAVRKWTVDGAGVRVITDTSEYLADRLIICGGAWSYDLLETLGLPLVIRRMVTAWFPTNNPSHRIEGGFPVFGFQTPAGFFYGFPALDYRGIKIAGHELGDVVDTPAKVNRTVTESDVEPLRDFATCHIPDLGPQVGSSTVCLYTMSPDGHFILDHHPEHDQVVFAAGLSGHGFKFCPVIGTILADIATTGKTALPCDFLRLKRLYSV